MAESEQPQPQTTVDPTTHCCTCDELLGTERPLVTLLCTCKAHTDCFLRDLGAKQNTELPEICPRCKADYIPMDIRDEIHQLIVSAEIEEENVRREMNPCFALNEGSPEFVTDIDKCKVIAKDIKKYQKEYQSLVSSTVKKYKEDTKAMAAVLKSTRRDAIQKIISAPYAKAYRASVSRFCSFVSRMARKYDFSHGEWMRFTRQYYPTLYRSFYRYGRHTYYGWSLRRKFRYGL